jgi:hypothetical protein
VAGGAASFGGADVNSRLLAFAHRGNAAADGITRRCPALTGALAGAETQTLVGRVDLAEGTDHPQTATWEAPGEQHTLTARPPSECKVGQGSPQVDLGRVMRAGPPAFGHASPVGHRRPSRSISRGRDRRAR